MSPEALARLHARCFTVPRPWSAAEFAAFLDDPTIRLLSRPGGFLLLRVAGGEAEILTLCVAPEARRQGLARALIEEAETACAASGCAEIFLEVAETNAPARALYEGCGFVPAGLRKDYYATPTGPKVSALVLRKPLQPRPT